MGKETNTIAKKYYCIALLCVQGKVLAHLLITWDSLLSAKLQKSVQSGFKSDESTNDYVSALRIGGALARVLMWNAHNLRVFWHLHIHT